MTFLKSIRRILNLSHSILLWKHRGVYFIRVCDADGYGIVEIAADTLHLLAVKAWRKCKALL
jgi:hypothetical protein